MTRHGTRTADGGATDSRSLPQRVASAVQRRGRDGSLATLAGSALLGVALRAARSRRDRATMLGLAGLAAFGVGVRQRRAASGAERVDTGADARRDEGGEKAVSDDAHAQVYQDLGAGRNADESASVYESESDANPRGVADGVDAQTDQGGDVEFVEGKVPGTHRETHLEDEDAHDPRLHPDNDAERTQIDLSEAAMADEASEAAGPHPEQAYPAREGTDPEPTGKGAPEWVAGSEVASEADEADSAAEQSAPGEETDDRADERSGEPAEEEADDRADEGTEDSAEEGAQDR